MTTDPSPSSGLNGALARVIRGEAAIQRISAVELATRAGLNRTTADSGWNEPCQ